MNRTVRKLKTLIGNLAWSLHLPTNNTASPALAVRSWVRDLQRNPLPPLKGRIGLMAVRNPTWIEFAVYAACWMRKLGYGPIVFYSRRDVKKIYGDPTRRRTLLQRVYLKDFWETARCIPDAEFVDLSENIEVTDDLQAAYAEFADDYAHSVAAYELYVEEYEEGPLRAQYEQRVVEETQRLLHGAAMADGVFRRASERGSISRLIAYSGLIGITPAVAEAGRRHGCDVAFVEGWGIKPGHMICNINAPAVEWNVKNWLESLGEWDDKQARAMERFLAYQENADAVHSADADAEWLEDLRRYQPTSGQEQLPERVERFMASGKPTALLAPNVVGDSATLRRQVIFRSQREWVREVCAFFRDRPDMNLVIRAHPGERLAGPRLMVKVGDAAEEFAKGIPNILVIKGLEKVSTYSLLPKVNVGLIWLSNVGVDMVIRDCPVVAAARCTHAGLGIVHEPSTRPEYFALLERLAARRSSTTPEQKELGKKYLAVLYKEASFEAFGPVWRGLDLRLDGHPAGKECEAFYRILAGDIPFQTRSSALVASKR